MKAFITGDAGFVGRHLRAALAAREGVEVFGCDLKYRADCRAWFLGEAHFDLVIHAAAVIGGRARIDREPLATAENLELDAAMFRWAARTRPGRVVYLSSSAVYPTYLQQGGLYRHPMDQLTEDRGGPGRSGLPDQTYGWSKLVGEHLAAQLTETAGVPVTVVRPFSGYGPDQDLDYPFPAFLARARAREDPFEIWGDGEQLRDFIHIGDLTAAILAAVDAGVDGPVNICTGRPTRFRELADMICTEVGYTPRFAPQPFAPQGVRYRVGSPARLHGIYRPRISLEEGVRMAVADG